MIEGRDFGDAQILQQTVQEPGEEGMVRYSTTLPSGRNLTSEWMRPTDMAGKTVISWCDHVRQQVDIDAREEAARKKREKLEREAGEMLEYKKDSVAEEVSIGSSSPLDYVRQNRDAYQERANILEARILELQNERKTVRLHLEQWEKILDSLRGETDE